MRVSILIQGSEKIMEAVLKGVFFNVKRLSMPCCITVEVPTHSSVRPGELEFYKNYNIKALGAFAHSV